MRIPLNRKALLGIAAAGAAATLVVAAPMAATSRPADRTADARKSIVGGSARNVILLIGDGMGDSEITIARNYAKGANGRLALDTLPLTGAYTTYSVKKDDPKQIDYVTDSSASGTGWATGYKTYNGAVSVTPDLKPKPTLLEVAKVLGMRTGNITTAEIQDATPAVQESHIDERGCYGPEDATADCPTFAKENGGLGSIEEQFLDHRADLLLGGGRQYFDQTVAGGKYAGSTVWAEAQARGYDRLETKAQLNALSAKSKAPVLGTFASGNFVTEYAPLTPSADDTAAQRCVPNPAYPATQPHLSDMAKKSISILDARSKGKKQGFFLQIEGASIDKRDHAADLCGQIGETVEFDGAVKAALDFQKKNPRTLVVVTADHGHTSQIVEAGTKTTGVTATVTTRDGSPMTVSYATVPYNAGSSSQQHTGTEVRIAAKGPQAANVLGITNQTDLNTTILRAFGLGALGLAKR